MTYRLVINGERYHQLPEEVELHTMLEFTNKFQFLVYIYSKFWMVPFILFIQFKVQSLQRSIWCNFTLSKAEMLLRILFVSRICTGAYPGGLWGPGPPRSLKGAPKIRKSKGKEEERERERERERESPPIFSPPLRAHIPLRNPLSKQAPKFS